MAKHPKGAAAPLIRSAPVADGEESVDLSRLLPAWIVSGVVHIVVLSLLLLIGVSAAPARQDREPAVINAAEEEAEHKGDNFDNSDIGDNPDFAASLPVQNVGDFNVPGAPKADDLPGVPGAIESAPRDVTPPMGLAPGAGGSDGGAAPGSGNPRESPGGPKNGMQSASFLGRMGTTKQAMIDGEGGNKRSEAAVAAGLDWLARHQFPDGHWSLKEFHLAGHCNCSGPGGACGGGDAAATGLALLPYLGAGITHKSGNIKSKRVKDALEWFLSHQDEQGKLGNGYAHALATICLCEAYGMTADPNLRAPAQRAVKACVDWQHEEGGFRYSPREAGDLSVTGWFVQAIKSGQMAQLNVPPSTIVGINKYLDSTASPDGAQYRYMAGSDYRHPMTAVGLLSRQYMGWGTRAPGVVKGIEVLRKQPPAPGYRDMYYYYYATQVVHNIGGDHWTEWNKSMRDLLIDTQDQGGTAGRADQRGSWSSEGDPWGSQLGRLGTTSLSLLTLEVYYRHLPLYRREMGAMKDGIVRDALR
jgi:hypothetical protein